MASHLPGELFTVPVGRGITPGGQRLPDRRCEAAVAAYRASVDIGRLLSERKLAALFGKTSRRSARHRMAEARGRAVG